ncbi:hypothetical protein [Carboxylicivirga caseinilyticus]|uniref:hypothetical protein n=1 Tax=Carboxylicivirga caseinilyticus TaxID=3417572 RepID=UPI003D3321BB|nr:hypothetical protein [Marinilabiliaceae bacterium A049]
MNKITISKHILIIAMCFFGLLQACDNQKNTNNVTSNEKINGELLADTIIYTVEIKNYDPNDHWKEECLKSLDRIKMIDKLFESVYNHKAQAFNYMTEAPMSISEVKAIEEQEGFSRDQVGKLQFWESWYYDEQNQIMTKKVLSVLVSYEANTDDGVFLGHKAAFYIKLK